MLKSEHHSEFPSNNPYGFVYSTPPSVYCRCRSPCDVWSPWFYRGWYAVISFFFVLILLQRRAVAAAEVQEALYRDVSEWVVAEHNKLYENKVGTTGTREFARYVRFFTREANLVDDGTKLDELTRKKENWCLLDPLTTKLYQISPKLLGRT